MAVQYTVNVSAEYEATILCDDALWWQACLLRWHDGRWSIKTRDGWLALPHFLVPDRARAELALAVAAWRAQRTEAAIAAGKA